MTTDFRRVYATMIKEWLGYEQTQLVLKGKFEPLGVFCRYDETSGFSRTRNGRSCAAHRRGRVDVPRGAAGAAATSAPASLDYEYFKTRVQPIFVAKRPGHARCVACHSGAHAAAPAAAGEGQRDVERGGVAEELRGRAARGGGRQSEERLLIHPLEESGRRRLLSQWWQALGLAERSRMADAEAWVLGQT